MKNEMTLIRNPGIGWANAAWSFLFQPHASLNDEASRRQAQALSILTFLLFIFNTIGLVGSVGANQGFVGNGYFLALVSVAAGASYALTRTSRYRLGLVVVLASILATIFLGPVFSADDTYRFIGSFLPFIFLVPLGVYSASQMLALTGITLALTLALPLFAPSVSYADSNYWLEFGQVLSIGMLASGAAGIRSAVERARLEEAQRANERLQQFSASLEERVAERTRAIALAAEVGRRVAQVHDSEGLLPQAVEMIRDAFNLYYVQVYRTDAQNRSLVLTAGSGDIGAALMGAGHRLAIDLSSLNGTAALERRPVVVENTLIAPAFRPHPLLPFTRAEIAVPLLSGERVLGVLDLQGREAGALSADNLPVFETLAGLLASALTNADLFAQVETTLEEQNRHAARTIREGWVEFLDAIHTRERIGYSYNGAGVQESAAPLEAGGGPGVLTVPVTILGEPVGTLRLEADQPWSQEAAELVETVAGQVAQQIENLRLLGQSESYRQEAEEAVRRLTGQEWQSYLEASGEGALAFVYQGAQVQSLGAPSNGRAAGPQVEIRVNDEPVGRIAVAGAADLSPEDAGLVETVSEQLAAHLENLRLYTSAQRELEERRRTEGLVEYQRRNLQAVLDNMAAAVLMVEVPSGRPILANRKAEEFLGPGVAPAAARAEGAPVYPAYRLGTDDLYPEAELPVFVGMGGMDAQIDDLEIRRPDGQRMLLDVAGSPVYDGEGRLVASVAVYQDITARKQAEDLIAKRAAQLATVSEVATVVSTIANPDEMLQTVVDMTRVSFDLYHAHIYLLDETGDTLVLSKGAGDVGRQMVSEGRRIALGSEKSIVAHAARTREGVIVNNVHKDPEFLPHPLLPDTQAEMAVPLLAGDRLLGVLDVQSDRVDHFSEEDILIQTTLASQVSVALQNARQHAETRSSEELVRTVINSTPDWIFIKDRGHRYRLVNQGYASALHLQPEDFIGKDDLELGFPEELVRGNPEKGIRGFWADDRLVLESNETHHYPNDPAVIDGKAHIFDTFKTPLRDARGAPWGVLAFSRDVTSLQALLQQNQTLYEGSRQLSRCATFEDVLRVLAENTLLQRFGSASINLFNRPWGSVLPDTVRVAAVWEREPGSAVFRAGQVLPVNVLPGIEQQAKSPTILAGDVQAMPEIDEGMRRFFAASGIRGLINFKIMVAGEWMGTIQAASREPIQLTEEETRIFQSLADQAVIVIQNLRLFEQVQSALEEMAGLYSANRRLTEARDLNEMLQAVLEAYNAPELKRAALFLFAYDSAGQLEGLVVRENYCEPGETPSFPTGLRLEDEAARAFFRQMQVDRPVFFEETDEMARANRIHSAAILPLWIGSHQLGVIALHAGQPHHFTEDEKHLSVSLAQQVAIAVQSRLLFEETLASEGRFRSTSEQLSQALAVARMGYFAFDPVRQVFTLNDQVLSVFDRTVEETGGYTLSAGRFGELFLYPEDLNLIPKALADAEKQPGSQPSFAVEHPFRRRDGSRGFLMIRIQAQRDTLGQVTQVTGAVQDITESRRAQETIAKRAAELATVAEVSTAVSTIQNPDEMLQTVVDLTKQAFGLYHTHIYLMNDTGDTLLLARGAGEMGRRMVAEGRKIALQAGQSLVARAARSRQGVIANDVHAEQGFLPHPLLPETCSEMAIPMVVGGVVLGVIDIQDQKVGRFTSEDVNIMTTLATQVAVSLQNARSYARAQRQAEREALINAISERIQSTDSIESALQVAVREIGRALGAQHTVIRLGLDHKDDC